MKKKQRLMYRILAILLCMVLITAMTACGGPAVSEAASSAGSAAQEAASATEPSAAEPVEEADVPPASDEPEAVSAEEASAEEAEETEAKSVEDMAPDTDYSGMYPIFEEPETFTVWVANSPDLSDVIDEFSDFLVIAELEELTNLHWDANLVSFSASEETFALMLASQDYTDVINGAVAGYTGGGDAAIDDDVIIDIQDLIPDNMPSLSYWMEEFPDLRKSMLSNEGHMCGFPKIQDPNYAAVSSGMLRKDWLDDLGIAVPATFDELHSILLAFQSDKDASTPMQIGSSTGVQDELLAGYNIQMTYYQVDGEVRFGAVQPEFRDYLAMMNQWYSENLIDPNFMSNGMGLLLDYTNVLNDETGVWYTCNLTAIASLESRAADENMSILSFSDVSVDGSRVHCAKKQSMFNPDAWSITTACSDPASICQYLDYLYSRDGVVLCNYGVEGYTYEVDDNGNRVFTDVLLNNPEYTYSMALNIYTCDMQTQIPYVLDSRKETSNYNEDQWASYYCSGENADNEYMMPGYATMTAKESLEYSSIYSDIETYMDENIAKFIIGDLSLDEFDGFVDTLYSMNVERCVELYQTALDRYLAK